MATFLAEGIVLKYYPYRDHDRLFTIYTREYGKMEIIGKGTNRIASKLAGHMEPFTHSQCMIATGRRWDVLAQARTITSYPCLKQSLQALSSLSVIAEAIDMLTKPMQRDDQLYQWLIRLSETWNTVEPNQYSVYEALWQTLVILGYAPRLESCVVCNAALAHALTPRFSFREGGLLCATCVSHDMDAWVVSHDAFVWLTTSLHPTKDYPVGSHHQLERATMRLITYYYQYIIGNQHIPKSLRFFKHIWQPVI